MESGEGPTGSEKQGLGKRIADSIKDRFGLMEGSDTRPPRFKEDVVNHDPSFSRILDLPLPHQSAALMVLYHALDYRVLRDFGGSEHRGSVTAITHPPDPIPLQGEEMESVGRVYADRFAALIEPDAVFKTVAQKEIEQRWEAFSKAYQEKRKEDKKTKGYPSHYEPQLGIAYQSVDSSLFSPEVRESRDLFYDLLQKHQVYQTGDRAIGVIMLNKLLSHDVDGRRHYRNYLSPDVQRVGQVHRS